MVGIDPCLGELEHHCRVAEPPLGFPKGIGAPATRALAGAGYNELRQLDKVPASDLQELHGMGPKALRILQGALEDMGMSLGASEVSATGPPPSPPRGRDSSTG